MSRSLMVNGVTPARPPINSTSAADGVDAIRSETLPTDCAGAWFGIASTSASAGPAAHAIFARVIVCISERGIEAEQDVVFLVQMASEVRAGRLGLAEEIEIDFDDSLDVAHEVIGRRQAQAVHGDAFVDGAAVREVAGAVVVVERRECPALVGNPVHAGKSAAPAVRACRIGVEEPVPCIPQVLGVPVEVGADLPRGIEADDALVGVPLTAGDAGGAGRATLLAGGPEQSPRNRPDVAADAPEYGLGAVVVEHLVGAAE